MAAINPQDLSKFSGIMEVKLEGTNVWKRLASVRGLTTTINNTNVVEIKADDTGTVLKLSDRTASIGFEFLENTWRDTLALLFGGNAEDIAWSPVNVTGEEIGTDVWASSIYILENSNGNGSIVTGVTVTDSGWALIAWTDYTVAVDSDWDSQIVFLQDTTWATTVDYTYTPNDTEKLTLSIWNVELRNFACRVRAIEGNKERVTTLTSATLNTEYSISYADVVEQGDITGSNLVFETNKGSELIYENSIL